MPKGFTEQDKTRIRERLVQGGYRLFAAHGLKKTSVDELAAAAHISKGAFYLFYDSKEALFMDVAEWAEQRFRQQVLAVVERPGPSPRARLFAVLRTAFELARTVPLLQGISRADFDRLSARVPPEKLAQHFAADRLFFQELVARCQAAGIPIRAAPESINRLMYPLALAVLSNADQWLDAGQRGLDGLLELIAAYCLGEVTLQAAGLDAATITGADA